MSELKTIRTKKKKVDNIVAGKEKSGLTRNKMIGIKVNPLEENYIKTVAKLKGLTMSEYMRRCAMSPSEFM